MLRQHNPKREAEKLRSPAGVRNPDKMKRRAIINTVKIDVVMNLRHLSEQPWLLQKSVEGSFMKAHRLLLSTNHLD